MTRRIIGSWLPASGAGSSRENDCVRLASSAAAEEGDTASDIVGSEGEDDEAASRASSLIAPWAAEGRGEESGMFSIAEVELRRS